MAFMDFLNYIADSLIPGGNGLIPQSMLRGMPPPLPVSDPSIPSTTINAGMLPNPNIAAAQAQAAGVTPGAINGPAVPPSGPLAGPPVPPTTGGFTPRPPGGGGPNQDQVWRNQLLFGDADPKSAMIQAMLDAGLNPYTANPFIELMMESAPGLQASFVMENAGQGGLNQGGINEAGGAGSMLRNYLMDAIQNKSILSKTEGARRSLGGVPGMLNDYATQKARGLDANNINPFMEQMMALFGSPNSAGDAFTALTAPGLGSSRLARAFGSGMGAVTTGAVRRQADAGVPVGSGDPNNPSLGNPFWEYIFGNR